MNRRLAGKLGIALCGALLGCTTYGQSSVSVGVSVEIRAKSDFYEPLAPYGRWEVVGSYGRCWIPGHVESDWRPYSDGYWQRTDAGWYWVSDEPWGWATYHYGRWNLSDQYGWYWVPQTRWAPAWVSWHSGGGYIGWTPLYPSGVRIISPRAYVFVEERHFMEPVRRSTMVVGNTTIINKTVINKAPATAVIERTSGRKIQVVPVQELRHKQEAAVVTKQRTPTATSEKTVQTPVRREVQPAEQKAVAAHEPPQVEKTAVVTHETAAPAPKNNKARSEKQNSVPTAPEFKPEAKHPEAIKESTRQNADKQSVKQERSAPPSEKRDQQPVKEKPVAGENNGANPAADKDHENKGKDKE